MLDEQLMKIFPLHMREILKKTDLVQDDLEEIRVRVGQPLMFLTGKGEYVLDTESCMLGPAVSEAYRMTAADLEEMLGFLCQYSLYAYEEQLRMGYLTLQGGHRVGVAGEAALRDGQIIRLQHIYFLNIRIAKQKRNCARHLVEAIRCGNSIYNTLLISPPGVGKTTYLRDAIRLLSSGDSRWRGMKIGVVDERSEIGAGYMGIPQNDLGPRTDVLEGAGKSEGIYMLLRSMSPQVIAVDELGEQEDFAAVNRAFHSGCRLIGTLHGEGIEDIEKLQEFWNWRERKRIERYIFLEKSSDGRRNMRVCNGDLEELKGCQL